MASNTYLRAITNELNTPILLKDGEDDRLFYTVAANSTHKIEYVGPGPWEPKGVVIPWVERQAEMGKAMTIHWSGRTQYHLFQDYSQDIISCCRDGMFASRLPVGGANAQGGRKVLTIALSGLFLVALSS